MPSHDTTKEFSMLTSPSLASLRFIKCFSNIKLMAPQLRVGSWFFRPVLRPFFFFFPLLFSPFPPFLCIFSPSKVLDLSPFLLSEGTHGSVMGTREVFSYCPLDDNLCHLKQPPPILPFIEGGWLFNHQSSLIN
jgi:hypothetical protein